MKIAFLITFTTLLITQLASARSLELSNEDFLSNRGMFDRSKIILKHIIEEDEIDYKDGSLRTIQETLGGGGGVLLLGIQIGAELLDGIGLIEGWDERLRPIKVEYKTSDNMFTLRQVAVFAHSEDRPYTTMRFVGEPEILINLDLITSIADMIDTSIKCQVRSNEFIIHNKEANYDVESIDEVLLEACNINDMIDELRGSALLHKNTIKEVHWVK